MEAIQTPAAPAAIGPYSQAVRASSLIFVSGQIPLDPASGELIHDDVYRATHCVLGHVRSILEAAGAELRHVVRATVFLTDMADFPEMNRAYAEVFAEPFPARACVAVARLPKDARVEISVIACVDQG